MPSIPKKIAFLLWVITSILLAVVFCFYSYYLYISMNSAALIIQKCVFVFIILWAIVELILEFKRKKNTNVETNLYQKIIEEFPRKYKTPEPYFKSQELRTEKQNKKKAFVFKISTVFFFVACSFIPLNFYTDAYITKTINGKHFISNRGSIGRELTEEEFAENKVAKIRFPLFFLSLFLGVGNVLLFSQIKEGKIEY